MTRRKAEEKSDKNKASRYMKSKHSMNKVRHRCCQQRFMGPQRVSVIWPLLGTYEHLPLSPDRFREEPFHGVHKAIPPEHFCHNIIGHYSSHVGDCIHSPSYFPGVSRDRS